MADCWIKMRGSLLDHPKVIAITRILLANREFRDWLTPGGGGASNGKIVSDAASRAVTVASLLRAWSTGRETGKFVGDDLHLRHSTIEDIDQFAGTPGLGEAMAEVGWIEEFEGEDGIFFPNFKEFNVPKDERERSKDYRDRRKRSVTEASRSARDESGDNVTPRGRVEGEYLLGVSSSPPTNPTTSQVSPGRPAKLNGNHAAARELLEFLNFRSGKNFRMVPANLKLIEARLASGVTPQRVKQVILRKWREWEVRPEMQKFLRPETLFNATKFEQYLGEMPVENVSEELPGL